MRKVHSSMSGYCKEALVHFVYQMKCKCKQLHCYEEPAYGTKIQYTKQEDTLPKLDNVPRGTRIRCSATPNRRNHHFVLEYDHFPPKIRYHSLLAIRAFFGTARKCTQLQVADVTTTFFRNSLPALPARAKSLGNRR